MIDDGTWHCMTDAPKDGTEVELLLRHPNYRHCKTDEERAQWEQVVRGKWVDFNGGGWTWHGMYGSAWGWRPLPSNVQGQGEDTSAACGRSPAPGGSTTRHRLADLTIALEAAESEVRVLRAAVKKANDQAEHFERGWYLRGDALEAALAWADSEHGRSVPQIDGQPGGWINKARDIMGSNSNSPTPPAA